MRAIAFRNGTLDRNTGRNVKRSADVSGNARHFCDGELNYTGYEGGPATANKFLQTPKQDSISNPVFVYSKLTYKLILIF